MIDPAEVGRHCGFSAPRTIEFCAETLTGVNAHNEAMLLRALQGGNHEDALRIVANRQSYASRRPFWARSRPDGG